MSLALSAPTLMSPSPHTLSSKEEILTLFSHFRDELDEHNDRRERLIKVCVRTRAYTLQKIMRPFSDHP